MLNLSTKTLWERKVWYKIGKCIVDVYELQKSIIKRSSNYVGPVSTGLLEPTHYHKHLETIWKIL